VYHVPLASTPTAANVSNVISPQTASPVPLLAFVLPALISLLLLMVNVLNAQKTASVVRVLQHALSANSAMVYLITNANNVYLHAANVLMMISGFVKHALLGSTCPRAHVRTVEAIVWNVTLKGHVFAVKIYIMWRRENANLLVLVRVSNVQQKISKLASSKCAQSVWQGIEYRTVNVLVIYRVMKMKVVKGVLLVGFFSAISALLAQPLLAAHNAPQLTSINAQNVLKVTLCPTTIVWNVLRHVIVAYQYTSVLIVRVGTTIFSRLEG
jgi:hypothetical protein